MRTKTRVAFDSRMCYRFRLVSGAIREISDGARRIAGAEQESGRQAVAATLAPRVNVGPT